VKSLSLEVLSLLAALVWQDTVGGTGKTSSSPENLNQILQVADYDTLEKITFNQIVSPKAYATGRSFCYNMLK